ncbi:MAG: plasmid mobilization relaxosome protein MobC [Abditibacteriota bacterium]|nr:plasmid mobilization relaxosome protein MobC [Abditibacteriota bacterium]
MRRNEGRTVGLYTTVTPEERAVIDEKMARAGTDNLRAYLRKMALDGYVVRVDMDAVLETVKLLRSVSNNVNQIAKRCNETRNLYAEDVEDLRRGYARVWSEIGKLLKKFEEL